MSEHDDRLPMYQMLGPACEAIGFVRGRSRTELVSNRVLELALAHLLLIVGEATTRVSPAGHARYSEIPWSDAIGTANFIAHGYDQMDYDVIWDTIAEHFPPLVVVQERLLSGESS